ncbi:MAG TPA: tungstate ABC transporter substrate-binding protein WtpA [Bacteroidales bacterium]|nr:tungstate ABC transporter substrate-binding protein WtpA [Bacteroidales bacterium]
MKKYNPKKLLAVLAATLFIFSCNPDKKNNELIIFHAGSLSVPFKQMKEQFEKENPGVNIFLESAGSVKCARKITDLNKPCDIMASADFKIIDQLLIPEYAEWNIQFATNEMAIVYHEDSKYANEINHNNWHNILLRQDVFFGRSDPNSDPCGYRAILTTQLAEEYYNLPGLTEQITSKNQEYIRPKEVDLLALLESNTIDYIFLYRSVAEQHGLKYVILPDSINLKNPDLNDFYKTANVEITGKKPGSKITQTGKAMIYGVTILKNAPNKNLAKKFIDFVLTDSLGAQIMERNGQPAILKIDDQYKNKIPENLMRYFQ